MTMRHSNRADQSRKQGFVLVSILWMIAILTVIVLGFGHRALLERRIAWYELDQAQAQAMARGAVNRALLELENKRLLDTVHKQLGYTGLDQHWAMPVNLLEESDYFLLSNDDDFKDEVCTYTIIDCERFISINDAPREVLESLDMFSFTTLDDLMDTREVDEGDQSGRLLSPDALFDFDGAESIDEDLWFGNEDTPGMRAQLTVYGSPSDGRVNVNTAPREVLALIPKLSDSALDAIMTYRNGPDEIAGTADDKAFSSLRAIRKELNTSAGEFSPIQKYCKTDSQWFKITTHATRRGGAINAYCTVIVEKKLNTTTIHHWKEGIVAQ